MMIALGAYVGLFDAARFVKSEMGILTGNEDVPEKRPFGAQIDDWWNCILMMARFGGNNGLDPHLWTIPLETMSSMNLFVTLAALSRIPFTIRIILLTLLILITVWWNWEGEFLFFAGGLLADLHLESGAGMDVPHSLQEATSITRPKKQRRVFVSSRPLCWHVPGVRPRLGRHHDSGLHLVGINQTLFMARGSPSLEICWSHNYRLGGFAFMKKHIRFFTNRFTQYLGKVSLHIYTDTLYALCGLTIDNQISFALYLMHGPVIRSLGFCYCPLYVRDRRRTRNCLRLLYRLDFDGLCYFTLHILGCRRLLSLRGYP